MAKVPAHSKLSLTLSIDGRETTAEVEPRDLLVLALREKFGVTSPHIGCETGRCGACTILLDGVAIKSCMTLAVQARGSEITTAAGLHKHRIGAALQSAFKTCHALQCGFCTSGMLASATTLLQENSDPSEEDVRQALRGNLCRCTGYQHIIDAVLLAARNLSEEVLV